MKYITFGLKQHRQQPIFQHVGSTRHRDCPKKAFPMAGWSRLHWTTANPPKMNRYWLKLQVTLKLTHSGRATHICVSKLTSIASENGLSPGRRQAIIWNNAGILSIGLLGTNFSEILIEVLIFSFKKMRLKVSSAKWRPFCLGLNVLTAFLCWWCRHENLPRPRW